MTTFYGYDSLGNLRTIKDQKGNTTSISYSDSWSSGSTGCTIGSGSNSYAYPTSVAAGGLTITSTYNKCIGVAMSSTDPNSQTTSYDYNDPLLRLKSIRMPDAASGTPSVQYTYNHYNGSSVPYSNVAIQTLHSATTTTSSNLMVDGLGRALKTQGANGAYVQYVYGYNTSSHQSYQQVSNPYTTSASYWTTTFQDGAGRFVGTTYQDSSVDTVTYSDNCVTGGDPASHSRTLCMDALGRIGQVKEDPSGLNFVTNYSYDGLDNLTTASQTSGPSRSFTYDGLSRLVYDSPAEAGITTYSYLSGGSPCSGAPSSPCTRTDANGTVTTYSYDSLNRLTGKSYGGNSIGTSTPTVTYYYDQTSYNGLSISNGKGQRTGISDGSGATAWSYDVDGNTAAVRRTINGVTKEADYTYNSDSSPNTLSNFGGTTFTYSYDSAGQPTQIADGLGNTYASSATYTATGQLSSVNHQLTSGSALYARSWQYNSRLQPSVISATLNSNTIQSLSYGYGTSGTNNGNILAITNGMNSSRNQTYTYDNINRLASGRDTSHWGETYTYNSSGSLYQTTPMTGLAGNSWSVTAYSNNHLSNLTYDSAGQVTQDQFSNSYGYDAEGRVLSVGSNTYVYDADGSRVKKTGGTSRLYWTGANGEILNESDLSGNMASAYVYFDGVRIARRDTPSTIDVRFTNDSCSGCSGGTPVGGGDRNLILNSLSVGTTTFPYNSSSLNYTSDGCSSISGGALWVPCTGDVILSTTVQASNIAFNGWGQMDYYIYPHVQLYGNGALAGEFDVTGSSQSYSANTVYFYLQDHLGSARMVASAAGKVLDDVDHYPFGGVANNFGNGPSGNHYSFADYESDATESSSYHTPFRQLSPSLGRWQRPDPDLGSIDLTDPQSLNRYAYVGNNPLSFVDPSGLNQANPGYCGPENADPCDGGIGIDIGWGDGGGGGGGGGGYPTPDPQYDWTKPIWNEHLGLKQGMKLPGFSLGGLFGLPEGCEFGVCGNLSQSLRPGDLAPAAAPINFAPFVFQLFAFARALEGAPKSDSNVADQWPFNGNLVPATFRQDGVCSTGALSGPMNSDVLVRACCQTHDNCYVQHRCNASSWSSVYFGNFGSCSVCNVKATACVKQALLPGVPFIP